MTTLRAAWRNLCVEWAKWLLGVLAVGVLAYGTIGYEVGVSNRLDQFHQTVCVVLAASKAQDAAQARFYQGAASRARLRADTDTGSLRQADLDSAASDTNLAHQYARGERFHFPGC